MFLINGLEMVLSYLTVTRITHYYIIMVARAALRGFIIRNAKGSITSINRYLIIKRTLFSFKEKFAITSSKRRY